MNRPYLLQGTRPIPQPTIHARFRSDFKRVASLCAVAAVLAAGAAMAQVTVNTKTGVVTNGPTVNTESTVDRRYQQITPTQVPLTKIGLDAKTRLELIRVMQSEQGFAMRPFPRGHKGLTLAANGKLNPAGEGYLEMVIAHGMSAKPGDRVVLTDVKIEHSSIVFLLNGGPDLKHRFLSHIQIGMGPNAQSPVVRGDDQEPVGARLTLTFNGPIPELTGVEVKALLAPLISFDVKTPIQAFTDTLPTKLKEAILNHHVLVGMSTDMVLFAKGQPETKSREMDGQMPFEEWVYGKPPHDVEFVRINGNRVIRVEIAKMGETPVIFTKDEVEGMMRTDGTPLEAAKTNTRTIQMGDVQRNPDTQEPAAPPSLRKPGETLPDVNIPGGDPNVGVMRPVQFPKKKADPQPGANPDGEPETQQPAPAQPPAGVQASTPDASQPAPAQPQTAPPAGATQPK